MVIDKVGKTEPLSYNQDPVQPVGAKKVKKFDDELAGQLSGVTNKTAYLPNVGDIGSLLNGSKGSGTAATQV